MSTLETDSEQEQGSPPTTWSPQSVSSHGTGVEKGEVVKIRNLSIDEDNVDGKHGGINVESWEVESVSVSEVRKGQQVKPYMPVGVGVGVAF